MESLIEPQSIAKIILHVTCFAILLTTLFFTYTIGIEKTITKNQVQVLVDSFIGYFPSGTFSNIKVPIDSNDYQNDLMVNENNTNIRNMATSAIFIFSVVSFAVVYLMSSKYDFELEDMVKENLIVMIFVGITEIIFLTFYASKFQLVDTNHVKYMLIDAVKQEVNS
jgi:hypothetical protein